MFAIAIAGEGEGFGGIGDSKCLLFERLFFCRRFNPPPLFGGSCKEDEENKRFFLFYI